MTNSQWFFPTDSTFNFDDGQLDYLGGDFAVFHGFLSRQKRAPGQARTADIRISSTVYKYGALTN